jgi:hypothetical protein
VLSVKNEADYEVLFWSTAYVNGRALANEFICWPLTAEVQFWSRARPCEVCGGEGSTLLSVCQHHSFSVLRLTNLAGRISERNLENLKQSSSQIQIFCDVAPFESVFVSPWLENRNNKFHRKFGKKKRSERPSHSRRPEYSITRAGSFKSCKAVLYWTMESAGKKCSSRCFLCCRTNIRIDFECWGVAVELNGS